ncbi:MAG: minor capsid protein [Anaerotignaceae bacterium]
MATSNKQYWKKRMDLLEESLLDKGAECVEHMKTSYQRAFFSIQKDVESFHQRFAKDNELTLNDAEKLLTSTERQAFKMQLEEYMEKAEKAGNLEAIKDLKNASTVHQIERLEALQYQIKQNIDQMEFDKETSLDKTLRDIYEDGYYKTAYEIQKGTKTSAPFAMLDQRKIDKIIASPWASDGKNFSERVWKDRNVLVEQLKTTFKDGIISGTAPDKIIAQMQEKMEGSFSSTRRLVMTESAAFASAATNDSYGSLGVEKYEITVSFDEKTCNMCGARDGEVHDTKDYKVGETAPPFHPDCACDTIPYFDDEFTENETKTARDLDGNLTEIPANMRYEDWKKELDKEGKTDVYRKYRNDPKLNSEKEQYNRYISVLGAENVPKTFEEFRKKRYTKDDTKWEKLKNSYKVVNSYEDNSGKMNKSKILELDRKAFTIKTQQFTGNAKRKGNIAVMEIDGEFKIANSQVNEKADAGYENFKGKKGDIVFQEINPMFETKVVGSHSRDIDSEAKLLEYAAKIANDGKPHTINLLSEKCMCESCLDVMRQFKETYPNVEVNAVSNKAERVATNKNKPWGGRNEP